MTKKLIHLEQSDINIIEDVKKKYGLTSNSKALRHIMSRFLVNENRETGLQIAILNSIEEKSTLLLDVANTGLVIRGDEICYPVREIESPVIRKAREMYEKQRKDRKGN